MAKGYWLSTGSIKDGIRDHAQSRGLGDVYKRQSKNLVKPEIRSEAIERMKICSAQTSTAVAAMLKELSNTNEDPPPKLIEMATADFPYFWMRSLEDIRQGR